MPPTGNVWGTSQPTPVPPVFVPAIDVDCVAGSETAAIPCTALLAISAGSYFALITGVLTIVLGATAPGALIVAALFNGGADFDSFTVEPGLLVNAAELVIPFAFVSPSAPGVFVGAGAEIDITVAPTGQDVTCKAVGSRALVQLVRGPD